MNPSVAATLFGPVRLRLKRLSQSTLLMNALYLMLSTLVMAASGFAFWAVIAHTYDTTAVGLATTLLSVSSLLSLLGLAGFDTTFVRFLPGSVRKNEYINSGLIIVTVVSALIAMCLAVALPIVSPGLSLLSTLWGFLGFVCFTVVTSLNVLTNAVFLAFKQARAIFVINSIFGVCKIALALSIGRRNALTIFVLAGSAQLVGLGLSIVWMHRRCGYRFLPRIDMAAVHAIKRFSFSVYISSVLNLVPPTLLPLIIIHQLGPKNAAYYYMAFTVAGVLYAIAYASMQSVFAEGSHDEAALKAYVAKAAKVIGVLLIPAAAILVLCSGVLLAVFGIDYAQGGAGLLRLFAFGALPVAVYSAFGAIFKVTKNLRGVVSMNIVYAAAILGVSYVFMPRLGLRAVGWGWVVGNLLACCVGALFFSINGNRRLKKRLKGNHGTTSTSRR